MTDWILRVGAVDRRLLRALALRRRPWLTFVMRGVTRLGGAVSAISITGLLVLGAVPGLEAAGTHAAFALAISHVLSQTLKRSVSRPRPHLPVGLGSLVEAPDRFSFPSGHASASLAVAIPVTIAVSGLFGLGILLVAVAIGISRCYLGVHYPGDVLMGWGLALTSVFASGLFLP